MENQFTKSLIVLIWASLPHNILIVIHHELRNLCFQSTSTWFYQRICLHDSDFCERDDLKLNIFVSDGTSYVRRKSNTQLSKYNLKATVTHGCGNAMVWDWIYQTQSTNVALQHIQSLVTENVSGSFLQKFMFKIKINPTRLYSRNRLSLLTFNLYILARIFPVKLNPLLNLVYIFLFKNGISSRLSLNRINNTINKRVFLK